MALYIFSDAHLGADTEELEALKQEKLAALFGLVKTDGDRLIILVRLLV